MLKNNLKEVREEEGYSQLQLSYETEIAQGVISDIELGKRFAYEGWRERISETLGRDKEEIFPEEYDENE